MHRDPRDLFDRHDKMFENFGKTVNRGTKLAIVAWLVGAVGSITLTLAVLGFIAFVVLKVMAHYGIL